jgi:hypothetical protein
MSLAAQFRRLLDDGRLNLPFPDGGDTAWRHRELAQIARDNLELGRLAEAHTDALAILHEAGREPKPRALYGVWASEAKLGLKTYWLRCVRVGNRRLCGNFHRHNRIP